MATKVKKLKISFLRYLTFILNERQSRFRSLPAAEPSLQGSEGI